MPRKFVQSLRYAGSGVKHALATQRHIRIHIFIGISVVLFGIYFKLNNFELIALILTICLVLISEMINTAIEETINLITTTHRIEAKIAKDVAAGAVLFSTICAIIVGCLIFVPHVIRR